MDSNSKFWEDSRRTSKDTYLTWFVILCFVLVISIIFAFILVIASRSSTIAFCIASFCIGSLFSLVAITRKNER